MKNGFILLLICFALFSCEKEGDNTNDDEAYIEVNINDQTWLSQSSTVINESYFDESNKRLYLSANDGLNNFQLDMPYGMEPISDLTYNFNLTENGNQLCNSYLNASGINRQYSGEILEGNNGRVEVFFSCNDLSSQYTLDITFRGIPSR